jgi:hypothetical protein
MMNPPLLSCKSTWLKCKFKISSSGIRRLEPMMNTNNFFSLPFAVAVKGTVLVGRRNTVKGVFGNKVFLKF